MKKKVFLVLLTFLLLATAVTYYSLSPKETVALSRPLYWGARGSDVRVVQQKLHEWGYYAGDIDGVFGSATTSAVRAFQANEGLPVDGVVGTETWQALGFELAGGSRGTAYAAPARPTLYWGSRGASVRLLQSRLQQWGYYKGSIDGIYGGGTAQAVKRFQAKNGLGVDGVVGPRTWAYLGLASRGGQARPTAARAQAAAKGASSSDDANLLARLVSAEAEGEPYKGQVAVASVILNRVRNPKFPNSVSGVVFQPHAFESMTNGLVWRRSPDQTAVKAARDALNGYDPTQGCIFFWNPSKPITSKWIWSRPIITQIGSHVFAK